MRPTREPGEHFDAYLARVNAYFDANPPGTPIQNQRPDLIRSELRINEELIRSDLKIKKDQIRSDGGLGKEEALALARSWGLHDGNFKTAARRMSIEWVVQQINFVATAKHVTKKGSYLSSILAKNTI